MTEATELIAIRHGETGWNREGRLQGHLNSELNAEGRSQAQALGERMSTLRFDLLISSDLGRALQTAQAIATRTGHEIVLEPRLRERNLGIFQGLTAEEAEARYAVEYAHFKSRDPDYAIPEGESARQMYARCVACCTELALRYSGMTLACVTHGGVLAMLYRRARQLALDAPRDFPIHNTGINRFRLDADNWEVQSWGDIAHLEHALDDPV